MIKKSLAVLSTAVILSTGFAKEKVDNSTQKLIESAGKRSTQAVQAKEIEKVIQEALKAYQESQEVILLLAQGKVKEAKKKMEDIKKKLSHLQSQYKGKMDLLPISVVIAEIEGVDDIKLAKNILKQAKEACEKNDIPTARDLLEALRNEIQIQTHYLPLDVYTKAVDLAYQLLEKGDVKNALNALNVAISSIEIEEVIIPKPIAEALLLIDDAKRRFKNNPESAKKLLEEAKRKIKLAQALGYVRTEDEIKPIIKEIGKLEEKIEKETAKKVLFESLEKKVKEMQTKSTQTKSR